MSEPNGRVIVVLAIGAKYLAAFDRTCRQSLERYAARIGAKLVVMETNIEPSEKRCSWQRCLMFRHPDVAPYQRALSIDADIYVTKHAKDVFAAVGDRAWGACDDNPYNLAHVAQTNARLYDTCPPENRPDRMLNMGMFVIDKSYQPMLEYIYEHYPDQHCWEQGALSYHLLNDANGIILPSQFNTVLASYRNAHGKGLSSILALYEESSFIHFAGNKGFIFLPLFKYLDRTDASIARSVLYFFGAKRFDWLTAPLIRAAEKTVAIFNYHVRRRFRMLSGRA